ncbi:Ig-like domain-containing protein [Fimbriimonas ginsengisoli]|uniref:Ig domain protein group 1 domain protein n=1 Tax=Fimbriimonas ginsengisoli Gsoil 348 TaxID=661478 RepID=A0A068NML9_FIMGI|nr:Ig-like domain-containing protein [Fimbriimonas ginsengisoli]AIE84627.1 Ig domain protein group 1 domain protein [Fimbriimonas ginsengisoli Gsoil 348]
MSFRFNRPTALLALACTVSVAAADQLSAFPRISVADGRSTTTITAEVRDAQGRPVADGTRVLFNTNLGSFRENAATTANGIARAILVSGTQPGIAKITATPLAGGAGPTTLEFEFVADRAMLSSAREYIEIVAPGKMRYTVDTRLIGATGANKAVSVRFRDIEIQADDVQVDIPNYEVRARNAHLKIGKLVKDFDELYLKLNQRHGYGTTTFRGHATQFITTQGKWLGFAIERDDGSLDFDVQPDRDRYGLVEIKGPTLVPCTSTVPASNFEFQPILGAPSSIGAKKAVIFPGKLIQFQRADIYVADNKVMKLPLYQVNLQQSNSPLITEDLVAVNDNTLAINYPYYLSLKPGQTSLLRFRTGEAYGQRSYSSRGGAFVDYELNWSHGEDMEGGMFVKGLARRDWRLGVQQYYRLDSRSTASAQVEVPAGSSFFGSGSINRQFDGWQMSLNGSATRSLIGLRYSSQDFSFGATTDPRRTGKLPFQLTYGLTANTSSNSFSNLTQRAAGIQARLQSFPITLNPTMSLTTSFSASRLVGQNVLPGITLAASATVSKKLSSQSALLVTYDYMRDGFNDAVLGQHRLSATTYWNGGRTDFQLFATKSLDVDRMNIFGDLGYRLSGLWRLSGNYTLDKYLANEYLDYNIAIGYRLGWREIGLVWSKRTNRIGIQLLGATIN